MKKSKIGYIIIAFFFAQFFCLAVTCSAESLYQITETELTELEQNSNRQLAINSQLATDLQIAKEQLKASGQELTEAKQQTKQLQKQLNELEALSKNQENLQQKILTSLPPSAPECCPAH